MYQFETEDGHHACSNSQEPPEGWVLVEPTAGPFEEEVALDPPVGSEEGVSASKDTIDGVCYVLDSQDQIVSVAPYTVMPSGYSFAKSHSCPGDGHVALGISATVDDDGKVTITMIKDPPGDFSGPPEAYKVRVFDEGTPFDAQCMDINVVKNVDTTKLPHCMPGDAPNSCQCTPYSAPSRCTPSYSIPSECMIAPEGIGTPQLTFKPFDSMAQACGVTKKYCVTKIGGDDDDFYCSGTVTVSH